MSKKKKLTLPYRIISTIKRYTIDKPHEKPRKAIMLLNDGEHLFSTDGVFGISWLAYSAFQHDMPTDSLPGTDFIEKTVVLKSLGHTKNGSVHVYIRERYGNWHVLVRIDPGRVIAIIDSVSSVVAELHA